MENNPQLRVVPRATGAMTLANVKSGKRKEPYRILLAGVEGIGKTTWAANAPKPILVEPEEGSGHLDVPRFPPPSNYPDVLAAIEQLTTQPHEHQTLVIDTVDWLEPMLWRFICARDGEANIESYGYGKGYQAAVDEWRIFLGALERLQKTKGMNVILLAHTQLKTFKNPEGEDFDRYELKLNLKAAGVLKEWVKAVLFTNYETYAVKAKGAMKAKGVASGARLIYTTRSAAYDAKNRYSLPAALPLDWASFEKAVQLGQPMTDDELRAAITANAARLDEAIRTKVLEKAAGLTGEKLAEANNWVAAQVALLPSNPTTTSNTNPTKES